MKTSILMALGLLCGLFGAQSIEAQSGQELFQQALAMERSNGQVRDAIPLYQRILVQFASDRSLAANALIRLGHAYEALGSTEANRAYQRIVSDYADQQGQVAVARSRLAALATETVRGADGRVRPVLQPSQLCSDQPADAIATFEDPNLERKVRSALSIGAWEDLTCGLVSELTELDASYTELDASSAEIEKIESLVGIQNLTGLTRLSLRDNSITDVSPLNGLTNLTLLARISSDATIDDAAYASGIDVDSGATVTINSPAELGFTDIVSEQLGRGSVSVLAHDTSKIIVTGGTLNGEIRLLDSSMLILSGSVTVPNIELGGSSSADLSGAVICCHVHMSGAGNNFKMTGGTYEADLFASFGSSDATITMSGVTFAPPANGRDAFDLQDGTSGTTLNISNSTFGRDFLDDNPGTSDNTIILTNVHTGPDVFDLLTAGSVTWTGGSVTSEGADPGNPSDVIDLSGRSDYTVVLDGVPIIGWDALDIAGTSTVTFRNLTITGRDAVDARSISMTIFESVDVIGRDAFDLRGGAILRLTGVDVTGRDAFDLNDSVTVWLSGVDVTGDDPIDLNDTSRLFAENLTVDATGDEELDVYDEAVATIRGLDFAVDGVPVGYGSITATSGVLTGTNTNGSPLSLEFTRADAAQIILEESALGVGDVAAEALERIMEAREARSSVREGARLARAGEISEALQAYQHAQERDARLNITASSWNALCWWGSLWGYAAEVMAACERAVGLAPDHGGVMGSRGLARALTGDFAGAIEGFEAFVAWTGNDRNRARTQGWIDSLRAGRNPFTPELLEQIRNRQN